MYAVFSRPFTVQYRARFFSQTSIFFLLYSLAFRYIVPFLLVYLMDGFWLKESTYRETPNVHFTKKFLLLLEGRNATTSAPLTFGYSTFPALKQALVTSGAYLSPSLQERETDANGDGLLDALHLELSLPIDLPSSSIHQITLLLFFDYRLESQVNIRMNSIAEFRSSNWAPGKGVHFSGSLQLIQQVPFYHKGFDWRYRHQLISESGERLHIENEDVEEDPNILENTRPLFEMETLLKAYYGRDYYTQLTGTRASWSQYQAGIANASPEDEYQFTITGSINYRPQVFTYETGFWYLLKWALVQYLAAWMLTNWAVTKIEWIVYSNYMLPTVRNLSDSELLLTLKKKEY